MTNWYYFGAVGPGSRFPITLISDMFFETQ